MNGVNQTRLDLERVFVIGRFHRAAARGRGISPASPRPGCGRQSMIRSSGSRWRALVAAEVIDAAAPPQARMRQRQAFLGDLEQIAVPDPGLEAEARHVVAQRLALLRRSSASRYPRRHRGWRRHRAGRPRTPAAPAAGPTARRRRRAFPDSASAALRGKSSRDDWPSPTASGARRATRCSCPSKKSRNDEPATSI